MTRKLVLAEERTLAGGPVTPARRAPIEEAWICVAEIEPA
jgi:hypothetical protein